MNLNPSFNKWFIHPLFDQFKDRLQQLDLADEQKFVRLSIREIDNDIRIKKDKNQQKYLFNFFDIIMLKLLRKFLQPETTLGEKIEEEKRWITDYGLESMETEILKVGLTLNDFKEIEEDKIKLFEQIKDGDEQVFTPQHIQIMRTKSLQIKEKEKWCPHIDKHHDQKTFIFNFKQKDVNLFKQFLQENDYYKQLLVFEKGTIFTFKISQLSFDKLQCSWNRYKENNEYVQIIFIVYIEINLTITEEASKKTIIFVGERGSGKRNLINALINFLQYINPKNPQRYQNAKIKNKRIKIHQIQSKRQNLPNIQNIPCVQAINVSGFSEQNQLQDDERTIDELEESLKGIKQIDAVVFVIRSPNQKLTLYQKYIFEKLLMLFGNNLRFNITLMFTFYVTKNQGELYQFEQQQQYFNQTLEKEFYGRQQVFNKQENVTNLESYDECVRNFNFLFQSLQTLKPISTTNFEQGKEIRKQILSIITLNQPVQQEIEQNLLSIENPCLQYLIQKQSLENIYIEACKQKKAEKYQDIRDNENTTYCIVCDENCHKNCGLHPDEVRTKCSCIVNEKCLKCAQQCNFKYHYSRTFVVKYKLIDENCEFKQQIDQIQQEKKLLKRQIVQVIDYVVEKKDQSSRRFQISSQVLNQQSIFSYSFESTLQYIDYKIQQNRRNSQEQQKEIISQTLGKENELDKKQDLLRMTEVVKDIKARQYIQSLLYKKLKIGTETDMFSLSCLAMR